jgi:hypothetical protein
MGQHVARCNALVRWRDVSGFDSARFRYEGSRLRLVSSNSTFEDPLDLVRTHRIEIVRYFHLPRHEPQAFGLAKLTKHARNHPR